MRDAGLVVAEGLAAMQQAALPGVTTKELDDVGRSVLGRNNASSNFLGYGAGYGPPFPGVACISVNEELLHGIPGKRRLVAGDLVSIDFGAIVDGWHGDAARSFVVGGEPTMQQRDLIAAVEAAFWAGVARMRDGGLVSDISRGVENCIKELPVRYGNLRDYTGHGIGTEMHMEPDVPNRPRLRQRDRVTVGTVLAIEPMLTLGLHQTKTLDDEWTVVSRDGSIGAHWENTVALTERGLWVLTEPDGGEQELLARGLPFGAL